MVHLSKKYLEKEKLIKLYHLLFEVLSRSSNRDNFISIMNDILSPSEQEMIAKRIAIIYLLTKNTNFAAVAEYLKVSKSTVAKFSLLFYKKDTDLVKLVKFLISKGKILGFIEDLFMDFYIQPGIKRGHWKMKVDYQRAKEERKMFDV